MKRLFPFVIAFTALIFLTGCTRDAFTGEKEASRAGVGAGVGAAIGAIGGAIIGGNNKRKAVLIGAGVGALAGAGVGAYMDAQERKLRRQLEGTGVSVTRDGDNIILNMPSNITFDTDRAHLKPGFNRILDSVVLVLNEYEKTYIDVLGHTDSTGSDDYNMRLSVERAESVGNALMARDVIPERIIARGLGETMPIANNATAEGRALNRRVELALIPVT